MYTIELSEGAVEELEQMRAFEQRQVLDAIEESLTYEPAVETRNRKQLPSLIPPFEAAPPIWELRVGEYRVFYDVNEEQEKVFVRAIRRKAPHKTTEDIL